MTCLPSGFVVMPLTSLLLPFSCMPMPGVHIELYAVFPCFTFHPLGVVHPFLAAAWFVASKPEFACASAPAPASASGSSKQACTCSREQAAFEMRTQMCTACKAAQFVTAQSYLPVCMAMRFTQVWHGMSMHTGLLVLNWSINQFACLVLRTAHAHASKH